MTIPVPTKGILAALWLPTDSNRNLLKRELAQNIAFIKAHGAHGILGLGSTGEFPHLDLDQRKAALELVATLAAPLPVIANISDIRPHVVTELGRFAKRIGLPAVAIMSPGFFPSSQADMLEHFLNAADSSGLPVFLYNFPELTGTRIDLETVAAFADRAPMAGIKQSGGEFGYHQALIDLGRQKKFVVLSGADTRLPEVFALGATGCIGGLVNIAPDLMVHLFRVCREGAPGDTQEAFERLQVNVAAGMEARGLAVGVPKALVSAQSREIYRGIVDELRPLFAAWGLSSPEATAALTAG
jgi:4-hydroxy-tetrahydrodipicolinate synthase